MNPSRISQLFARCRAENSPALIAYITAGDPSLERTISLVEAMERGGADLIELGVPFSDPIADGPVIMRATERALAHGASLAGVIEVARRIRERSQIPILLFSYLNPLLRYGFERLAADAVAAGVDGILMTDASVEEAGKFVPVVRAAGLDTVFLAAPTSPMDRLKKVAEYSSGFIYLVSRTGVTGVQDQVSGSAAELVARMRQVTDLPLAVGFGIAKPADAGEVAKIADGVVVGSAFVRIIESYAGSPELESKLEAFTSELKAGALEGRK
jgi:tryptophan synthase alpha chain